MYVSLLFGSFGFVCQFTFNDSWTECRFEFDLQLLIWIDRIHQHGAFLFRVLGGDGLHIRLSNFCFPMKGGILETIGCIHRERAFMFLSKFEFFFNSRYARTNISRSQRPNTEASVPTRRPMSYFNSRQSVTSPRLMTFVSNSSSGLGITLQLNSGTRCLTLTSNPSNLCSY